MAVAARTRTPSLGSFGRLFMGPRIGTTMIVLGIVFAIAAAVMVVSLGRRARASAAETQNVQVAYVVVAARDIAEAAEIPADAVTIKPFPAAYLPAGAAAQVTDVAGKFATTRLAQDQIVLTSHVSPTRRSGTLAAGIPPGKVAVWLPLPELVAQTGGLRPGDRVDVLLSLALPASGAGAVSGQLSQSGAAAGAQPAAGQTTQLTLQNVEVYSVGTAGGSGAQGSGAGQPASSVGGAATQPAPAAPVGARTALVLLEPQDAVVAKFIKDSGGTIDLALRSREWPDVVTTSPVTADALADRFGFRTSGAAR